MKRQDDEPQPRRLYHFTPLRYPGGKGKLAAYVKQIVTDNALCDGEYVEPYAGGAAIALELLFQKYVSSIRINDVSHHVHSFWNSVLNHTDELCRRVRNTRLSVTSWDKQKRIFMNPADYDYVSVGFAAFFLNRTNRSGILNGGVIGGRDQSGPWKMNARYNADELIFRIESIAKLKKKIKLSKQDAISFLKSGLSRWTKKSLIYLDPPYYEQGRHLYYDYYKSEDHEEVAAFVASKMNARFWLVSYDNVRPIKELYAGFRSVVYNVGYTAREQRVGKEVMFFSPNMVTSDLIGPVRQIGKIKQAA
jgi:DNA adenine methylase